MHANGNRAASLSSGLLARKGGARPAMRRPTVQPVQSIDDLGWNDMGDEAHSLPLTPPAAVSPVLTPAPLPAPAKVPSPVAKQVAQLHEKLKPEAPSPDAIAPGAAPREEPAAKRKSAFTLRLNAERHLRLRLLSAVTNTSAQQLVTEALDALIACHPNVEELAADPKARTSVADPSNGKWGTSS